jgi:hypothetical protein
VVPQYTPTGPTLVREPFHRDGWVYEEKIDGWRMLACKDGQRVCLSAATASPKLHLRRHRMGADAVARGAAGGVGDDLQVSRTG